MRRQIELYDEFSKTGQFLTLEQTESVCKMARACVAIDVLNKDKKKGKPLGTGRPFSKTSDEDLEEIARTDETPEDTE